MTSVLGDRYASKEMQEIWSREFKIIKERELWVQVLRSQKDLGLNVDVSVIKAYEEKIHSINLLSIDERERTTQHDVMARIHEFNSLAGHQDIHIGMTSRDLTENIEIFQVKSSLDLVLFKCDALLLRLVEFSDRYKDLAIVGRTHNMPAQVTTLGRRFSMWLEELFFARQHLVEFMDRLPVRGIKGALGTLQDLQQLFPDGTRYINEDLKKFLGVENELIAPSQIYPRSIDFELATMLSQISAAHSNLAFNIRLMAGQGLLNEGFAKSQVGSSAMPHKINPRLSERVNSLASVIKGHVTMIQELSGNQWNEGDVSCSVVRRVVLPDAFFAIDSVLDTTIRVMDNLVINEKAIEVEVDENMPLLLSSSILMCAVNNGAGREEAHATIKKLANIARAEGSDIQQRFFALVTQESSLQVTNEDLTQLTSRSELVKIAVEQVKELAKKVTEKVGLVDSHKAYVPGKSI